MDEATLSTMIIKAIEKAKDENRTRGMSLVITKLEEAQFWLSQHRKELEDAARRVGFRSES